MIRIKMQEIFLKFVFSIIFPDLRFVQFGLPNAEIGQESGSTLYAKLLDPRAHHQLSLGIRQKFLRLAHCRFFISRFLGNYHIGDGAQYHHPPTTQTVFVLQHVCRIFFKPIEPNYPFESKHPPVSSINVVSLLKLLICFLKETHNLVILIVLAS